jgi:hypothetical protein
MPTLPEDFGWDYRHFALSEDVHLNFSGLYDEPFQVDAFRWTDAGIRGRESLTRYALYAGMVLRDFDMSTKVFPPGGRPKTYPFLPGHVRETTIDFMAIENHVLPFCKSLVAMLTEANRHHIHSEPSRITLYKAQQGGWNKVVDFMRGLTSDILYQDLVSAVVNLPVILFICCKCNILNGV